MYAFNELLELNVKISSINVCCVGDISSRADSTTSELNVAIDFRKELKGCGIFFMIRRTDNKLLGYFLHDV